MQMALWRRVFFGLVSILAIFFEPWVQDGSLAGEQEKSVHIELRTAPLGEKATLSLREAVEVALEHNPNLIIEKIRLEGAREKIEEERGTFDPVLALRALIGRRDNLQASRFFPSGTFIEDERAQEFGLQGKVATGSRYGINFGYQRLKSTSNTQTLSPQYAPTLTFSFSQPLLRDFGVEVNLARIWVAQKGEEFAEQELAVQVSTLIRALVEAYWNFVYLRQDLEVKRVSLELARALLKQNEDLLRAGRVAPVSVLEARAGVAERQEALILSENDVKKAEDQVKLLLHAEIAGVELLPGDRLKFEPVELDPERSLSLAFKQRPDLLKLEREVEQRELERKLANNATLPRLDFNSRYGVAGLAGRPNKTPVSTGGPPAGDSVAGSAFQGNTSPRDGFNRFFHRDPYDNWSLELKLEIPLFNRAAKAKLSEAQLRLLESQAAVRALRAQVVVQVRGAVRDILSARERIAATREAVRWFEDQLDGTRRKFEAGLATTYEVLKVMDDLARARSSELKGLRDYQIAQSALGFAEGTLLEAYNVEIKRPPRFVFQHVP